MQKIDIPRRDETYTTTISSAVVVFYYLFVRISTYPIWKSVDTIIYKSKYKPFKSSFLYYINIKIFFANFSGLIPFAKNLHFYLQQRPVQPAPTLIENPNTPNHDPHQRQPIMGQETTKNGSWKVGVKVENELKNHSRSVVNCKVGMHYWTQFQLKHP